MHYEITTVFYKKEKNDSHWNQELDYQTFPSFPTQSSNSRQLDKNDG